MKGGEGKGKEEYVVCDMLGRFGWTLSLFPTTIILFSLERLSPICLEKSTHHRRVSLRGSTSVQMSYAKLALTRRAGGILEDGWDGKLDTRSRCVVFCWPISYPLPSTHPSTVSTPSVPTTERSLSLRTLSTPTRNTLLPCPGCRGPFVST